MVTNTGVRSKSVKRGWQRLNLKVPFKVAGQDDQGADFASSANTVNVSGGGGCLMLDRWVAKGQTLELRDVSGAAFTVSVQWSHHPADGDLTRIGFKIIEASRDWVVREIPR